MTATIALERFTTEIYDLLRETFEEVQGIYLDKGTSLFETLDGISTEEAARPVSATCASIAAQVNHVRFYLDVLERELRTGEEVDGSDWDGSWRIGPVTEATWVDLREELRASHRRVLATLRGLDRWDGEFQVGNALAIVVHTAYHLGEIRQALCTVRG